MEAGAVANLQHVRDAVSTARLVMQYTSHTLLSGEQADAFAAEMGKKLFNLSTAGSFRNFKIWWGGLKLAKY